MKITRNRIREIVKETLNRNKRLTEIGEPADGAVEPAAASGAPEPRQDIGKLITKILGDGGDELQIQTLQKMYHGLSPQKKVIVLDALIKQITGSDVGDKQLYQALQNPDN